MNEDQEKTIHKWFKGHKAELLHSTLNDSNFFILLWHNPQSLTKAVRYVIDGYRLYITGDIGDAIYIFSDPIDLKKIATYDFKKFNSRLTTMSRPAYQFKPELVKEEFDERLKKRIKNLVTCKSGHESEEQIINDFWATEYDLFGSYREVYDHFLLNIPDDLSCYLEHVRKNYDFLTAFFNDQELYEWIYKTGKIHSIEKYAYWLGIKFAVENLK